MKRRSFFMGLFGVLGLGADGKVSAESKIPQFHNIFGHDESCLPKPLDKMMGFEQAVQCMKAGYGVFNIFYDRWFRIPKEIELPIPQGFHFPQEENLAPLTGYFSHSDYSCIPLEMEIAGGYAPIKISWRMLLPKEGCLGWTLIRRKKKYTINEADLYREREAIRQTWIKFKF